jgi:hypothetical protein
MLPVIAGRVYGQENKLAIHSVAIFKNGYAFCQAAGKFNVTQGRALIRELPPAAYGSLWFTSNVNLQAIRNVTGEKLAPRPAKSWYELLEANMGKEVRLTIAPGNSTTQLIEGKIDWVEANVVALQTNNGWRSIQINEIKMLDFPQSPNKNYQPKDSGRVIEVIPEQKNLAVIDLTACFLTGDITWAPVYQLEIINDSKARLRLHAELHTQIALTETEINFVVGVPNFRFLSAPGTLVTEADLRKVLLQLAAAGSTDLSRTPHRSDRMSSLMSQNYIRYEETNPENGEIEHLGGELESASQVEDLFFYTIKSVTLPAGGRASYQIFETEINYAPIYEVNLPGNTATISGYTNPEETPEKRTHQVWHSIKIENKTTFPWTTGSCLVQKKSDQEVKSVALSQELLSFTPPGGNSTIRLTVAGDISVTESEQETDREEKIKLKGTDYYTYNRLSVKGIITIRSFRKSPIQLRITRLIQGELLSSVPEWKVEKKAKLLSVGNQTNAVTWDIAVPGNAADSKVIEYSYTVYVRN